MKASQLPNLPSHRHVLIMATGAMDGAESQLLCPHRLISVPLISQRHDLKAARGCGAQAVCNCCDLPRITYTRAHDGIEFGALTRRPTLQLACSCSAGTLRRSMSCCAGREGVPAVDAGGRNPTLTLTLILILTLTLTLTLPLTLALQPSGLTWRCWPS